MLLAALVLTAAPVAPVTELRLRRAELGLPSADRAAVVLHGEGHGGDGGREQQHHGRDRDRRGTRQQRRPRDAHEQRGVGDGENREEPVRHVGAVTHRPERRFTWQIGDGAALARALGVRVVNDLRIADVTAGGQGAPLVPVYHAALAHDLPRPLAVVNVGGVANVTWIGPAGELLAFDTGPGNGPVLSRRACAAHRF